MRLRWLEISGHVDHKALVLHFLTYLLPDFSVDPGLVTSPCLTVVPKQASHGRRILGGGIFPRSLALLPQGNILTSASSLNQCCIHRALDTPSNLYKRPQPFKRPKFCFKCHHPGCSLLPSFKTTLPHLQWLVHTSQKKSH